MSPDVAVLDAHRLRREAPRIVGLLLGLAVAVAITTTLWAGLPITAAALIATVVTGLSLGSIYAMAATGLVVTYSTTGIFNFAQGAIAMFMAFLYWEATVNRGLPAPAAILLVVVVIAPLFGVALEVLLMRHLVGVPLVVQLVVTIGLMFFLMGLVQTAWDPSVGRYVEFLFGFDGVSIGDTMVPWHRVIAIGTALALALALRFLLFGTRVGVTMRAVVDDRDLAALHCARPARVSMLSWALSSATAAIAGILLAPETTVGVEPLALLTIACFGPAIIGRLRSVPMTFVGSMLLGLSVSFAKTWLDTSGRWSLLPDALPAIFLLVALLLLPQSRLRHAQIGRRGNPRARRPASLAETSVAMVVLVAVVVVVSAGMSTVDLNRLTLAVVTAMLLLSYIPLTGWSGLVSLAQITFAGIGAFTMWKVAGESGSPWALVLCAAITAPFGVLMALPALRLQGLYLALSSLAFALLGQYLLFGQPEVFGASGHVLRRGELLGVDLTDQRNFLVFATVVFALLALGVTGLRRSRVGRRLIAVRDSEAASVTFGVSPLATKLAVSALSAALAGLAGGVLALQRTSATAADFSMLAGVGFLLLVVVGGIELVSGALFGGILAVVLVVAQTWSDAPWLRSVEILGPGLLALGVAVNPDGVMSAVGRALEPLAVWRRDRRRPPPHAGAVADRPREAA